MITARIREAALLLVLTPGLGTGRATPPASVDRTESLTKRFEAYMKPILAVNGFTGFVLVTRKGEVVLSRGYGMANLELGVPNTSRTRFHIASVSKTFTAAAIMILDERDLLSVDDPLTKFLPDYPKGDRIKIHHLLTNTSGIANINNFPEYDTWQKLPHTVEDLIEKFRDKPMDFSPGERPYTESNSNYNLLAFIIQRVSGRGFGDFLQENIFGPLGMKDTGHHGDPASVLPNRASGYMPAGTIGFENAPFIDYSVKTGNGSIYSTAEDLSRWDRALYTDAVLKKASIARMFDNDYGWFHRNKFQRRVVMMNGRSPGFQCELQRYLDDDTFVLVLGNSYITTPSLIATDLAAMVFGEAYEIPAISQPTRVESRTLDAYVGRYQFGPDFFAPNVISTIENRGGQLHSTSRGDTILIPQSEVKFFDRSVWAMITFVKDDRGAVTHFLWRYAGRDYRASKIAGK